MFNTHEDAASKINGEIESLVRQLDYKHGVDDDYLKICQAIKDLAAASAMLVPASPIE